MAEATAPGPLEQGPDLLDAIKAVRKRRSLIKKAKTAAEEVAYLNITAMMDMMTIILVFLLKGVSFSATTPPDTNSIELPKSSTTENAMDAVKVFITKTAVIVEDKKVAEIKDGLVTQEFISPDNGYVVPNLQAALKIELDKQIKLAALAAAAGEVGPDGNKMLDVKFGNLTLFGDNNTLYDTLMQVLYSSGGVVGNHPETGDPVGFSNFRLMVSKLVAE